MNRKLISIALSALVLPGLGQLYLGRRVKGGVMLFLDNLFILGALFVALRSAGKLMLAGRGGTVDPEQVLAGIRADNPHAMWLLAGFLAVWAYAVVDALLDKGDGPGRQ